MNRTGLDRYSSLPPSKPSPRRQSNTGPSKETIALVKARSGGRCEYPGCGRPATERHHRAERGMGGSSVEWVNDPSAILDACHHHNQWASNGHPAEAFAMGWRIRRGLDRPWSVPVQTRHDELPVWLDRQGGWWKFDEGTP